jgi:hypothetical protein
MKYFYEYNLKYRGGAGLRTVMGSAVHAVMECLGDLKKAHQDGEKTVETEFGEMSTAGLLDNPRTLSDEEIDKINHGRRNKSTYVDRCDLEYGIVRENEDLINELMELAFQKYLKSFDDEGKMKPADRRDYENFVWMTLEKLDPRKENVFAVEKEFDLPILEDWAILPTGEYLRIKGFVDLITEPEDGVLYIYDYKTGARKDWNTGDKKTYDKIKTDLQLRMYHYAMSQIYPDKYILCNLFYIRDGGMFSVCFDDTSKEILYQDLKTHVQKVTSCEQPKLLDPTRKNFKCRLFCPAYKNKNFDVNLCDCQFLSSAIKELGIDKVQDLYKNPEAFKV